MARLQVYSNGTMVMDPLLEVGPTVVGRRDREPGGPPVIDLKSDDVSRTHLVLEVERTERGTLQFQITDQSLHGTTLNDVRLRKGERTRALPGEEIGVPGLQLVITLDDTPHGANKPTVERHLVDVPEAFGLAGSHPRIEDVRRKIDQFARRVSPVHVRGATGTGKDLVARAIHSRSGRPGRLIVLNCATITRELLRSELFGHVRGSFTGALHEKLGAFVLAREGTLFLDEIAQLAPDVQGMLLVALESGEVWPIGADEPVKTDVRVITATSAPLEAMVDRKEFLPDLYSRIMTLPIAMPALAERPADLEAIIEAIRLARKLKIRLHAETVELLRYRPWPGNVRQLAGTLERLAAQHEHKVILPYHVRCDDEDQEFMAKCVSSTDTRPSRDAPHTAAETARSKRVGRPAADCDVPAMVRAIDAAGGNLKAAARALGVPYTTFLDRARRHGLVRPRKPEPEPEPEPV